MKTNKQSFNASNKPVYDEETTCPGCSRIFLTEDSNYCSYCGCELPKTTTVADGLVIIHWNNKSGESTYPK